MNQLTQYDNQDYIDDRPSSSNSAVSILDSPTKVRFQCKSSLNILRISTASAMTETNFSIFESHSDFLLLYDLG